MELSACHVTSPNRRASMNSAAVSVGLLQAIRCLDGCKAMINDSASDGTMEASKYAAALAQDLAR